MNIQQLNPLYWPFKFYSISSLMILYKKKEARGMGKSFLGNIPHLRAKSQAESSAMAQAAGPLGNLAIK
jgi:hypothetical protein